MKTDKYSIYVTTCIGNKSESFTDSGLYIYQCPGECMLFPSKEIRDWSTLKVPRKRKEYNFKPFDKVLVRDKDNDVWQINLFAYICIGGDFKYQTITAGWKQCIPFEGNEHLLGTSNPA